MLLFLLVGLRTPASGQGETIYASVLNSREHQWGRADNPVTGLFVSTDAGMSWMHRGWKEYIRTFYAEQGPDATIWEACGNGVLRSTDGGVMWRVTTGWEVTEVLKVKVDPVDPLTVFASTAYGIIKSTNGGERWSSLPDGFHSRFTADVCINRRERNHILAATEEGIYASNDGGAHWALSGLPGKGIRVIVQDLHEDGTFWVGTEEDGLFCSTDRGREWHQKNEGLRHRTIYCVALDPKNPAILFAGTHGGGVYRTDNGGKTWGQKINGLSNLDIHSLAVLKSDSGVIFAGTLNDGLFKSTDGGNTWVFNSQKGAQVWGLSVR